MSFAPVPRVANPLRIDVPGATVLTTRRCLSRKFVFSLRDYTFWVNDDAHYNGLICNNPTCVNFGVLRPACMQPRADDEQDGDFVSQGTPASGNVISLASRSAHDVFSFKPGLP